MGGQGGTGIYLRFCKLYLCSCMRSVGKAGGDVKKDQGCRDGRGGLGHVREKQWRLQDAGAHVAQE